MRGISDATSLEDAAASRRSSSRARAALGALSTSSTRPLGEPGKEPLPEAFAAVSAHAPGDAMT